MFAQNFVLLCILLITMTVSADVSDNYRYNRPETAQLSRPISIPYPAAGFRPNQKFDLPNDFERASSSSQPFSSASTNQQRQRHQPQSVPQRTYLTPNQDHINGLNKAIPNIVPHKPQSTYLSPLPTMKTKPARLLTNNREDEQEEDVEDFAASDIEVNVDMSKATKTSGNQLSTPTIATLAYYSIAPLASYYQIQPTAYATSFFGQPLHSAALIAANAIPAPYNNNLNVTTTEAAASAQQRSSKLSNSQQAITQPTLNLPIYQIW